MSNPFKKNPLELEKVLEKIISRLQELGLISPNADPRELLEKTMENLKQSLGEGNLPRGELLKDPMILMKLTLSVIATHKDPANAPVNKIFQMQTPEQLQELKKELQLTPEILKFMELCIGEKVKQDNDSTDAAANKNAFVGLYSADGTLIENMGLFATSDAASAKIQTVEGLLRISGIAEMLNTDIKNDILSLETSPTLKLY